MATTDDTRENALTIMPCGVECQFAESWPHLGEEWVWCARPAAAQRLVRAGRDCANFAPSSDAVDETEAAGGAH